MRLRVALSVGTVLLGFLLIVMAWPALGSPPLQGNETNQALTIDALINERFTQTSVVLTETATHEPRASATSTPTPNLEATADTLFNNYLTATAQAFPLEVSPDVQLEAARQLGQGWTLVESGSYYDAIDQFTSVIELDPLWAEGYVGRGYAYTATLDFDAAILDFETAIRYDDNDADLFGGWLCYLLLATDHYQEGIEACDKAIELNPGFAAVYNNRGYGYEQTGRFDDAIADYTHAILLNPDEAQYYLNRQNIYSIVDNFDYYTMDSYLVNGMQDIVQGDLGDALAEFTEAINFEGYYTSILPSSHAAAYYQRGQIYHEFGNTDAALDDYKLAILNAAEFTPAYLRRAELLYEQGDTQTALGSYQRVFQVDPDYAPSYLSRALIYDAEGETTLAMADYLQWIRYSQTRDIPWSRFNSGEDFTLYLAPGWTYSLPFTGAAGQLIEVEADVLASFDLENPENNDTQFDGESAKLRLQSDSAVADPLLVLLNSAGQPLIAANNISDENLNAFLRFILPADDTYTLVLAQVGQFGGAVQVNLNIGPILSSNDLTATAAAYTPTPTLTPTNTFTPTFTPTLTFTPSNTPTPSPTLDTAANAFQPLGELRVSEVDGVVWRDNESLITISATDGLVAHTLGDLQHPRELGPYNVYPSSFAISPDGHLLVTGEESIRVDDAQTGNFVEWLNGHGAYVAGLAFREDGRLMASGDADGRIFIWDMTTFERVSSFAMPDGRLMDMDYSADGNWVAALDFDNRATLWDVSDPANPRSFLKIGYETYDASFSANQLIIFSPDSRIIAIATSTDVILWDMQTFRELGRLEHADIVNSVDISPDSTTLAAGLVDGTVHLWHLPTQTEIKTLEPDDAVAIVDAVFSPDGQKIVVRDDNARAWIWGIRQ